MKKILITESIHEIGIRELEKNFNVRVASNTSYEVLEREISSADGVIVRSANITKQLIERGEKLKVIARHGAGTDNVDVPYATSKGIFVINAPEANILSVAEHTITVLGLLAKRLIIYNQAVRNNSFCIRNSYQSEELFGKILGIVGIGRIGSLVCKKAQDAFGMKIIAFDPYKDNSQFIKIGAERIDSLEELIEKSEFISLHVPLTKETRNLIGKQELSIMSSKSFLLNISRGGVVDEEALYQALKYHKIAGAALDVFLEEPPKNNHPLFELDNILLTPHIGGLTSQAVIRMAYCVAQGVTDALTEKIPEYLVNPNVIEVIRNDNELRRIK